MKVQYDIWLVNLSPSLGTEPGKIRLAVVIQTNLLNQTGHLSTLICPITSQLSAEENILRVRVGTTTTGLDQESEILVDLIRGLDNQRFIEKLGKLEPTKSLELHQKLKAILDF
ncbi:type II toxin-antitoxin system PemK/MazF family toxin [Algoriphagus sp.]|uniref:type II toxin-antitoxin system PemK/MazF family toxin n=1 Tax=Algoriphagus sp. TaxID=1872435 RepID=UPI00271D62E4|nr:type II toxin-antitoxin system PemK/MazF family toxin [Algoriphagus sp.]MDO8968040.1 type II toxin-antitoxin system PemK/MazF family toxin [Algoriphagus sp.]MDP3199112.1 type II toxin-antitoxin system PemK/MazF family toxin [Algoriphagus sp.]